MLQTETLSHAKLVAFAKVLGSRPGFVSLSLNCQSARALLNSEDQVIMSHMQISQQRSAGMPGELAQYASRTLDFLNVIEKTLASVVREREFVRAMINSVIRQREAVIKAGKDGEFDPTGRVSDLLSKSAAAVHRCYLESIGYRDSARDDPDLFDDDGIVECFCDLVADFADLHNAIEDLRDAVETHDALRSPVIGTFENVEDLIAALKS